MRAASALAAVVFLLGCASRTGAQPLPAGPQVVTYRSDVDGSNQPYALYVPPGWDPARAYPLVISLHGEGANHRVGLRQVFGRGIRPGEPMGEVSPFFPPLPDVPFLVAAPLGRGQAGYEGVWEKDVYDVLADVRRRLPVDGDRIYLTGVSEGGGGALRLAFTRPDLWAAVVAVCPRLPPGMEPLLGNGSNLPVRIYQGELDPLVPASGMRVFQKRLLAAGVNVEYIEYPLVRHNAWDNAYAGGRIFEWFARNRRHSSPDRVSFTTAQYKYAGAWWVRVDSMTPGTPGSVEATRTGRRIVVKTRGVDGFTLSGGPVEQVEIDGAAVRPERTTSFHRTAGGWRAGLLPRGSREKGPGAEGPMTEAVSSRQFYVYGTADNPSDEERQRRRQMAQRAAGSSVPAERVSAALPVLADSEVPAGDARSANLILFGTAQTNSLIARVAAGLPLALYPSAADYGLVFVYPDNGRYLLISSGLPWWTGADQTRRAAPLGLRPPYPPRRLLETFGDFLVFKGSLENIVAEGRFENDWSVPPAAAATIKATGAIAIR